MSTNRPELQGEWLKLALRFSPVAALDAPPAHSGKNDQVEDPRYTGINIDITGCARLFKGEDSIARNIAEGCRALNCTARIAIGPSLGAAWACSRHHPQDLLIFDRVRPVLDELPVSALRISKKIENDLQEINIRRIEQLLQLPRKMLVSRFGAALLDALDLALGIKEEPLTPARIARPFKGERIFNGSCIQQEALLLAAEELLDEMLGRVDKAWKAVSRLVVVLRVSGAPAQAKEIKLNFPTNNKKHLLNLIGHSLENCLPGFGIDSLAVYFTHFAGVRGRKTAYLELENAREEQQATKDAAELLDSLQKELGPENVLQVECKQSHLPENAFTYARFSFNRETAAESLVQTERPSLLFYQPKPIQAMAVMPDSPPFWIKWQGKTCRVISGFGPERIAPEWWGGNDPLFLTRDYFKIQLENGGWLWVFRELENSRWFIHGLWA